MVNRLVDPRHGLPLLGLIYTPSSLFFSPTLLTTLYTTLHFSFPLNHTTSTFTQCLVSTLVTLSPLTSSSRKSFFFFFLFFSLLLSVLPRD